MVKEIMEQIEKEEKKAGRTVEDAKYKASYMKETARKDADKALSDALARQDRQAENAMEEARREGGLYASEKEKETMRIKEELFSSAREKEQGAVSLVISCITG